MKRFITLLSATALLGVTANAFAQFNGSDLVVSLVDSGVDGVAPTSAAAQVRLVAYSRVNGRDVLPTGQFYNLPTSASGLNHILTNSGSATSEGEITLSEDGNYLLLVGYDAAPGTAAVATTTSATVNRVVARIDWTKPQETAIDTTTALSNVYSGSNIRGAASLDGQTFYLSGNNGATLGGVSVATLGATTATPSYGGTTTRNVRDIRFFDGSLYVSAATGSGPLFGVGLVTPGSTTELPGFPTATGPSSYGFFFLDADTLYVADDSAANGGIQKWIKINGTWQLSTTLTIPAASGTGVVGARTLAGSPFFDEDQGVIFAQLYAVTTDNRIVTIVDDHPGETFTVVDTGTTSKVFRGIEVIRPKTVTVGGMAFLTGAVNFQIPVTVEFRPHDGSPVFSRTVTVAADDTYTVTGVPAGKVYTLHVKADNFLAGNHDVNTYSEDDIDADVTMLPGDANNDNTVDGIDFGALVNAYGDTYTIGDPNAPAVDVAADFNVDGMIDVADFSALVSDYGLMGDP